MKKIIILICIGLVIVAGIFTVWKYAAPARTTLNICSVKTGEVEVIVLQNGRNGNIKEIRDKNKISLILDKLNSVQYKYLDNKNFDGFVLSVRLFSREKEVAYMFYSTDEVLRLKDARYKKTSGGFDMDELLKYTEE